DGACDASPEEGHAARPVRRPPKVAAGGGTPHAWPPSRRPAPPGAIAQSRKLQVRRHARPQAALKAPAVAAPRVPGAAAREAGLRHVSDADPGIRRRRAGKGFTYLGPDGRTIRDRETLSRIRALAIPPAWTDVWICPGARGHIQAT